MNEVSLIRADLNGADLWSANLMGANLMAADLNRFVINIDVYMRSYLARPILNTEWLCQPVGRA